jgi:hypothetical protein
MQGNAPEINELLIAHPPTPSQREGEILFFLRKGASYIKSSRKIRTERGLITKDGEGDVT